MVSCFTDGIRDRRAGKTQRFCGRDVENDGKMRRIGRRPNGEKAPSDRKMRISKELLKTVRKESEGIVLPREDDGLNRTINMLERSS